jgi:hypothetical protein
MLGTETIDPVRDLGSVAWTDPSARLERMNGQEWRQLLAFEKRNFNRAANDPDVQVRIPAFKESLLEAKKSISSAAWFSLWYNRQGMDDVQAALNISPNGGGGSIRWSYASHGSRTSEAEDIDVDHEPVRSLTELMIYTINDVGGGSEDFKLTCQSIGDSNIWHKDGVGPSVAVIGDRVFYLRHKKRLWYNRLCSCDKSDGSDERVEYELYDFHYNLSLLKVSGGVFLKADNNGYSMLFDINGRRGVHRIDEDAIWHIPVGKLYGPIRFVLTTRGRWQLRNQNNKIDIPEQFLEQYGEPYFYDYLSETVLTRKNGIVYILKVTRGLDKIPIRVAAIGGGHVTPDIYSRFTDRATMCLKVLVEDPCKAPYSLFIDRKEEEVHIRSPYTGADNNHFNRVRVRSADGTSVYAGYVVRREPGQGRRVPRGLLVVIYGAYGMPTIIGSIMKKWGPLLEAGWAIGFAYVRGGGDNGWDWAEAGRRDQRYKSLEDAEACITGLRRRLRIPASNTMIYGRSAGGIQVGALANRHPRGDLFRGIYCEVPYLDVLQTTTNPSLPLTQLEYDEFGDPRHRLADLSFWVRHSPVTNVPAQGLPELMILCRTGLNDTQVYAYEPLKWILRARGQSPAPTMPKLLGIAVDQGHFYSGRSELDARATDLAILDAFIGRFTSTQ